MEQELFKASATDGIVKALGIRLAYDVDQLHIVVDGVDITRTVKIEELRIFADTGKNVGVVLAEEKK